MDEFRLVGGVFKEVFGGRASVCKYFDRRLLLLWRLQCILCLKTALGTTFTSIKGVIRHCGTASLECKIKYMGINPALLKFLLH